MPQITLHYTANITSSVHFDEMFLKIHRILNETGGVDIGNCKSRALRFEDYFIGEGKPEKAFVHLDVALLEGRSDEVKSELGNEILEYLKSAYGTAIKQTDLQITVEIRDIPKRYYFKFPDNLKK